MTARFLAAVLVLATLSCADSSAPPPPPAATATPGGAADGLRPLSSRDTGPAGNEAGAGSADLAGLPPGHPPIEGAASTASPHDGPGVTGTVTLADSLASATLPSDVLYVMAKKDGTTIAVRRVESPSFPFEFELGSGDAMIAGTEFTGPVDVVVRVSKTGDAIPAAGDLEGTTPGVAVPSTGVAVRIDEVRD